MRWLLTSALTVAVIAFVGFATIVKSDVPELTWYSVVLLAASIICVLICLVIGVVYLRKYVIYLSREYQKPPPIQSGALVIEGIPPAITTGAITTFTTHSPSKWKFEYIEPIQSVWFTKPVERIISARDDVLPTFVDCEHRILWRLRNRIFGVPTPRIVVKAFTEKGIILEEENTYGVDVKLELIPMPSQVKQSKPHSKDSQG